MERIIESTVDAVEYGITHGKRYEAYDNEVDSFGFERYIIIDDSGLSSSVPKIYFNEIWD